MTTKTKTTKSIKNPVKKRGAKVGWRTVKLGDLMTVKHGFAFKGEHFSDKGEYVVLTPGNFELRGGFRLRPEKDRFYRGDFSDEYLLRKGNLIVAMTEQGPGLLGSPALIPESGKYLHNQRLGLVQALDASSEQDEKFLYYLFNTRAVRAQISASATGTKVRHTAPERIYQVEVEFSSNKGERSRIAETLAAFDEKIENNNRIIKALEEIAQAIFKEWFVNFRFPGHEKAKFVDSPLGKIPEGWEVVLAKEVVARLPQGKTYKAEDLQARGGVPVYDQSSEGVMGFHNEKPALLATIDNPVIIFGDHTCRMKLVIYPCSLGPNVIPFVAEKYSTMFVYFLTKNKIVQQEYKRHWSEFENRKYAVPAVALMNEFTALVTPIVQKESKIEEENQELATMRNLLLPKLMSGEIRV